jgi:uncharacterized protein (TIGR02466 family)
MLDFHFALPIYHSEIDIGLKNDLKKIGHELIAAEKFFMPVGWHSHYISEFSFKDRCLDDKIKQNLIKNLSYHIQEYTKGFSSNVGNVFSNEFQITNSWFSLFKKNNFGHVHMHSDADVSGVIYLESSEHGGDIYFLNPNKLAQHSRTFTNLDPIIKYSPKVSRILLFPGWLEHGIETNLTDNNRLSFSFNLIFSR